MKIKRLRPLSFVGVKKLHNVINDACGILKENYNKSTAELFRKEVDLYIDLSFGKILYPMGIYVMMRYGEVVCVGAFATSPMDDCDFEIFTINTKKKYQRRGYATTMVKFLLEEIAKQKYDYYNVLLSCRHKNVKFYEKFGFEVASKNRIKCIMIKKMKYGQEI